MRREGSPTFQPGGCFCHVIAAGSTSNLADYLSPTPKGEFAAGTARTLLVASVAVVPVVGRLLGHFIARLADLLREEVFHEFELMEAGGDRNEPALALAGLLGEVAGAGVAVLPHRLECRSQVLLSDGDGRLEHQDPPLHSLLLEGGLASLSQGGLDILVADLNGRLDAVAVSREEVLHGPKAAGVETNTGGGGGSHRRISFFCLFVSSPPPRELGEKFPRRRRTQLA